MATYHLAGDVTIDGVSNETSFQVLVQHEGEYFLATAYDNDQDGSVDESYANGEFGGRGLPEDVADEFLDEASDLAQNDLSPRIARLLDNVREGIRAGRIKPAPGIDGSVSIGNTPTCDGGRMFGTESMYQGTLWATPDNALSASVMIYMTDYNDDGRVDSLGITESIVDAEGRSVSNSWIQIYNRWEWNKETVGDPAEGHTRGCGVSRREDPDVNSLLRPLDPFLFPPDEKYRDFLEQRSK